MEKNCNIGNKSKSFNETQSKKGTNNEKILEIDQNKYLKRND